MYTTFTSESVCSGHPDKICDQISDTIVDAALTHDPYSRVAVETLVTENYVALAGEVTTKGKLDYSSIATNVIYHLGYRDPLLRFSSDSPITVKIHEQSSEIGKGVEADGAGDQGVMFGFACRETAELMPLPISLAHALTEKIDILRTTNTLPYLRPDGKAQVTVRYDKFTPVSIEKVVLAVPHHPEVSLKQVKEDLYSHCIVPILDTYKFYIRLEDVVINGTGVWHFSGPAADTGVTGRKIVVDTYGGMSPVGGGAFSGKDPTKVDRSGAYAARFLAKNIVAAGMADRCEVRLAYVIGVRYPLMQEVETFGTENKRNKVIKEYMNSLLDTSVAGIISGLELRHPIYRKTATYGHFGRNDFPWEKIKEIA